MAKIIDGQKIAAETRAEIKAETENFIAEKGVIPGLAVIIVGENPASQIYVRNKKKACEEAGMNSWVIEMPEQTTQSELMAEVERLKNDPAVHGILVQLPLPNHLDEKEVIAAIPPEKDVDAFHVVNTGRIMLGDYDFLPCTPAGVMKMLEYEGIDPCGKECVVVGRSNIVGTPMFNLMSRNASWANCTTTVCHSRTKDLASFTRQADILIVAIGKPEFITADMVKDGATVIDVGIHRIPDETRKSGYRIIGDVKHSEVDPKCEYVTPVPGGCGPLTIVSLLQNTFKAYKKNLKLD